MILNTRTQSRTDANSSQRGGTVAFVAAALLIVVGAVGCKSSDPAQQAAEAFLDAHYVFMDLEKSSALAGGLAVAKIQAEIDLIGQMAADEAFERPRINYAISEHRQGGGDAEIFGYKLHIQPAGGGGFSKQVLLTVRNGDTGQWQVTNFSDRDAVIHTSPAGPGAADSAK
jgi:hypothetical protein